MNPILLATDGSPSAHPAVEQAVKLAQATGRPLVAVAVWQVPVTTYAYGPMPWVPELAEAEQERAKTALKETERLASEAGVAFEAVLVEGLPVQSICELAEERSADMIVLGSHGWGTVKRLWFGSVSTGIGELMHWLYVAGKFTYFWQNARGSKTVAPATGLWNTRRALVTSPAMKLLPRRNLRPRD